MVTNWLKESEAAERLGYKPETLRKKVKGQLPRFPVRVTYTNIHGKRWQYSEKDIMAVLNHNATK